MRTRALVGLAGIAAAGFLAASVLGSAHAQTSVTLPTVTLPTVTLPTVTLPTVSVPTVSVPAVTVPTVSVPAVTVPTVSVPAVSVPAVTVPAVTVPAVTVPAVTVPAVSVPAVTTPTVSSPVGTVSVQPPSPGATVTTGPRATPTTTTTGTSRPESASRPHPAPGPTPTATASTPGPAAAGTGTGESGSTASGAGPASPVVAPRTGRQAVLLTGLRLKRVTGRRSVVQLRVVLSGPARVRFLVIGPAPGCDVVARLVLAGHRGLNRLPFGGRVHGKLLAPGTYTIVPQPAGRPRPAKAVAVTIDDRGIRPSAVLPPRNCGRAAVVPAPTTGAVLPYPAPIRSDVAAAESTMPPATEAHADKRAAKRLSLGGVTLPTVRKSPLLTALLIAQLGLSLALLAVATFGSADASTRFRTGQMVARHQPQIAFVGGALLVGTAVLYLLAQITS